MIYIATRISKAAMPTDQYRAANRTLVKAWTMSHAAAHTTNSVEAQRSMLPYIFTLFINLVRYNFDRKQARIAASTPRAWWIPDGSVAVPDAPTAATAATTMPA